MGYFPLPELKGKPNRIFVDGKTLNQIAKRMSSLFKDVYPDGTVKYHDNDRYYCIKWDDPNLCWHNGFIGYYALYAI